MCPGVCKDRLADAFQRFGRIPIEKRRIVVSPDHAAFGWDEDPFWSAGGLIHDGRGRVLLIRHTLAAGWGNAWVTPGGRLEEGETTLDGRERGHGPEAGALGRRRPERFLPRWLAWRAGRRCDHPASQQDGRPLRAPGPADPLHPRLASAGDETLQGIWRRVATPLHPRDQGCAIPSRPRS